MSISIFLDLGINVFHFIYIAISTSLQLYLLRDEVYPLLKWDIKCMGISPAKNFDHPLPSHLSSNKQWLADFEILYVSSTFTNITMPFMKPISKKSAIINFAILWNAWFTKIFCKIHGSNVFSTFDQNITSCATSFYFGRPIYFLLP